MHKTLVIINCKFVARYEENLQCVLCKFWKHTFQVLTYSVRSKHAPTRCHSDCSNLHSITVGTYLKNIMSNTLEICEFSVNTIEDITCNLFVKHFLRHDQKLSHSNSRS